MTCRWALLLFFYLLVTPVSAQQVHELDPSFLGVHPDAMGVSEDRLFISTRPEYGVLETLVYSPTMTEPIPFPSLSSQEHRLLGAFDGGLMYGDRSEHARLIFLDRTGVRHEINAPWSGDVRKTAVIDARLVVETDSGSEAQLWVVENVSAGFRRIATLDGSTYHGGWWMQGEKSLLIADLDPSTFEWSLVHWAAGDTTAARIDARVDHPDSRTIVEKDGRFAFMTYARTTWISDGTEEGTLRLNVPELEGLEIVPVGFLDSEIVICTCTPDTGCEMWITDGSASGTHILADAMPGNDSGLGLETSWQIGERALFTARSPDRDYELWTTEGPEASSAPLSPNPVPETAGISAFGVLNGYLYYRTDDGLTGQELWRTDGTIHRTEQVADLFPGSESSNPALLAVVDGRLYVSASVGGYGRQIVEHDPVSGETRQISSFGRGQPASGHPQGFIELDDRLIVVGQTGTSHSQVFDISPASRGVTSMFGDDGEALSIRPKLEITGVENSFVVDLAYMQLTDLEARTTVSLQPADTDLDSCDLPHAEIEGILYFCANDWENHGLYALDASIPSLTAVRPAELTGDRDAEPHVLGTHDGRLIVHRVNQVMAWNPSSNELSVIAEAPAPEYRDAALIVEDRLVYVSNGSHLSVVDIHTGERTEPIRNVSDFDDGPAIFHRPHVFTARGKTVFVSRRGNPEPNLQSLDVTSGDVADHGEIPEALYEPFARGLLSVVDNGAEAEVRMISWETFERSTLLSTTGGDERPVLLASADDRYVFSASTPDAGHEPWITDGSTRGTFMMADLYPGPLGSDPLPNDDGIKNSIVVNDVLWISAGMSGVGRELVSIDLSSISISAEKPVQLPGDVTVGAVWPNPVLGSAALEIHTPVPQRVTVEIFDVLGRRVGRAYAGVIGGESADRIEINAAGWAAGMYLLHVDGESFSMTRTLIRAR